MRPSIVAPANGEAKSDEYHLAKRKAIKHLPAHATLADYNALIGALLDQTENLVYH